MARLPKNGSTNGGDVAFAPFGLRDVTSLEFGVTEITAKAMVDVERERTTAAKHRHATPARQTTARQAIVAAVVLVIVGGCFYLRAHRRLSAAALVTVCVAGLTAVAAVPTVESWRAGRSERAEG